MSKNGHNQNISFFSVEMQSKNEERESMDTSIQAGNVVSEPINTYPDEQSEEQSGSTRAIPCLHHVPEHLHHLARQIHGLNESDLAHIADVAHHVATRDVYSLLPYTGNDWFLPQCTKVEAGAKRWGVKCGSYGLLKVIIAGRSVTLPVINVFVRIIVLILVWFALWNVLPDGLVLPGGYVWDPFVTVVVAAVVGGLLCRLLQIPPLVGVLWVAIMWNSIPYEGFLTSGILLQVKDTAAKLGLTVIMARAGYSLTLEGIRPHWKQSIMMATLPFVFESVVHAMVANKIFNYEDNYTWAFLQGIICSIVSPAVVVPCALYLENLGCSSNLKPLTLLLSAVGVEIVLGVWAANFIIGLLFYNQKLIIAIVLGPVQLIGGALLGICVGFIFFHFVELLKREAERLPNGKYQREHFYSTLDFATFVFLLLAVSMVFLGYRFNLAGGGCTMCVFFASTVTHFFFKDENSELEEQKRYIGTWFAFIWDNVSMPTLFALMGTKISIISIFKWSFFYRAMVCLLCSTIVRWLVTFVILYGSGLTSVEKIIVSVGYSGKASAQGSLGSIAATLVAQEILKLGSNNLISTKLTKQREYADNVQQMAALYVMFMAAVASLTLVRGGIAVFPKEQQ